MGRRLKFVRLGALLFAMSLLAACAAPAQATTKSSPATMEKLAGGLNRITMQQRAVERLGGVLRQTATK